MGSIYEIICWTTGLRYIGRTTQSLKKRLNCHKCAFRKGIHISSSLVLEYGNYEIYELESVQDKNMLSKKELYYIEHTDCVNVRNGFYDRKVGDEKYRNNNKGVILESQKKYRNSNKEKISKKGKETYICDVCNITLLKKSKNRHEKRRIHLEFIKQKLLS